MNRKVVIGIVSVALLGGAGLQKANAAIPVIDAENIAQAVMTVTNTLTQIQNQLLELKPMDSGFLQTQISDINQQINQMRSNAQQAQGLMNQSQSLEQKWQSTFGSIDTLFTSGATVTPDAQIAHSRNAAYTLDQTYQDAYRIAKQNANVDQDWQTLQQLMDANKSAVGNKQSIQIQNSLIAQQNALLLKQIQTQSATNAVLAATAAAQNQEDAQTTAQNKKIIETNNSYQKLTTIRRGLL